MLITIFDERSQKNSETCQYLCRDINLRAHFGEDRIIEFREARCPRCPFLVHIKGYTALENLYCFLTRS